MALRAQADPRAVAWLERAVALAPGDAVAREELSRARAGR
jgi:hypothetical protein